MLNFFSPLTLPVLGGFSLRFANVASLMLRNIVFDETQYISPQARGEQIQKKTLKKLMQLHSAFQSSSSSLRSQQSCDIL